MTFAEIIFFDDHNSDDHIFVFGENIGPDDHIFGNIWSSPPVCYKGTPARPKSRGIPLEEGNSSL